MNGVRDGHVGNQSGAALVLAQTQALFALLQIFAE